MVRNDDSRIREATKQYDEPFAADRDARPLARHNVAFITKLPTGAAGGRARQKFSSVSNAGFSARSTRWPSGRE